MPITCGELEVIRKRNPAFGDVSTLLDEIERLSILLADCHLVLDQVARSGSELAGPAAEMLRAHQCPGWKN